MKCNYCHKETEGELRIKTVGKMKTFPCCSSQFCLDGILREFTNSRQFLQWKLRKPDNNKIE